MIGIALVAFADCARASAEFVPHRGINVNPWFTRPVPLTAGAEPATLFPHIPPDNYRAELAKLRHAGFDFLRVPIASMPLADVTPDLQHRSLESIAAVSRTALDLGFGLLLDFHVPGAGAGSLTDMMANPAAKAKYLALLDRLVDDVATLDRQKIIVEIMNEPTPSCDDARWPSFELEIVSRLRARLPGIKLAVTGACYGNSEGVPFLPLALLADKNDTYVTFHYYRPYWFTHQGATWAGGAGQKFLTGLPWPSTAGDADHTIAEIRNAAPHNVFFKQLGAQGVTEAEDIVGKYFRWRPDEEMVASEIGAVGTWADTNGVPRSHVILGEFGVLKRERRWRGADMASAARWIAAVRGDAEANGFGWAMWSYKEGMALTTSDDGTDYYPDLVKALGL